MPSPDRGLQPNFKKNFSLSFYDVHKYPWFNAVFWVERPYLQVVIGGISGFLGYQTSPA